MQQEPSIEERAEQPYVAIKAFVTMETIGEAVPPLDGEVFEWLAARGIAPAGPPFWRYNVIDMERQLEVEAGVSVAEAVPGDERVLAGVLPGGKYATVLHTGHPATLVDATAALLDWAAKKGLKWDMSESADGQRWGSRLELYMTDPADEPDMNKWETELAFRLSE